MTNPQKPLSQVSHEAFQLLTEQLGVADTMRFINQFTNGHGNYTQERQAFVDQLSLDEILEQIKQTQPSPKLAKPGPNSQAES